MSRKVVVAGHLCMDLTPVFSDAVRGDVASVLVPGRLIQVGPEQVPVIRRFFPF